MTYASQFTFGELVESLGEAAKESLARHGRFVPMENLLLLAGIDISDSIDSQRCSQALQALRRRGLIRYRKDQRQWEIR